jgi:cardiolipin synthase
MNENQFTYQFYKTTTEAWEAMYQAIVEARRSIYWEIYIFVDDSAGKRFVDALIERSKSGVDVKVIIDAIGSSKFSDEAERRLIASGVELLRYNRLYPEIRLWNWIDRLLKRNHRKSLIIDEDTVFLGGVNVKADFQTWDDLFIRIKGKIARPLLRGFAKSYIYSGGKRESVKHLLHPKLEQVIPEIREKLRFMVHSASRAEMPRSKRFYLRALTLARESVNLLTPYYVPDRHFLRAVALARERGVEVNIFLPLRPDVQLMELIGRAYYELTIKAGASIYLLPEMHHGKALSVDSQLGLVGSINLMPRSFSHQEESAVSFTDEQMVNELNGLFNDLKSKAELLNIERWRRRHWLRRMSEWLAKKLEYFV